VVDQLLTLVIQSIVPRTVGVATLATQIVGTSWEPAHAGLRSRCESVDTAREAGTSALAVAADTRVERSMMASWLRGTMVTEYRSSGEELLIRHMVGAVRQALEVVDCGCRSFFLSLQEVMDFQFTVICDGVPIQLWITRPSVINMRVWKTCMKMMCSRGYAHDIIPLTLIGLDAKTPASLRIP